MHPVGPVVGNTVGVAVGHGTGDPPTPIRHDGIGLGVGVGVTPTIAALGLPGPPGFPPPGTAELPPPPPHATANANMAKTAPIERLIFRMPADPSDARLGVFPVRPVLPVETPWTRAQTGWSLASSRKALRSSSVSGVGSCPTTRTYSSP